MKPISHLPSPIFAASKPISHLLSSISAAALLLLPGCATPGSAPVDNAATRTGQNLVSIVSTAMQDYATANQNGVASLWSISKGLNAYSQIVKTTDDIKQLIVDWKATKGDTLANRIARLLNDSDASPATKALVVAKAAETVAANKGP